MVVLGPLSNLLVSSFWHHSKSSPRAPEETPLSNPHSAACHVYHTPILRLRSFCHVGLELALCDFELVKENVAVNHGSAGLRTGEKKTTGGEVCKCGACDKEKTRRCEQSYVCVWVSG
jgi:hypothetical protein